MYYSYYAGYTLLLTKFNTENVSFIGILWGCNDSLKLHIEI